MRDFAMAPHGTGGATGVKSGTQRYRWWRSYLSFLGIEEAEVKRQGGVKRLSSHVYCFHPASRQLGGSYPLLVVIHPCDSFERDVWRSR